MEIATGVDILNIHRLERILKLGDGVLLELLYSKAEQEAALRRPIPLQYYATRFAGKEAVVKALSRCKGEFSFHEIEILSKPNEAPYVHLSGKAKKAATKEALLEISISLSFDTDYVIAFAIAVFCEKQEGIG